MNIKLFKIILFYMQFFFTITIFVCIFITLRKNIVYCLSICKKSANAQKHTYNQTSIVHARNICQFT